MDHEMRHFCKPTLPYCTVSLEMCRPAGQHCKCAMSSICLGLDSFTAANCHMRGHFCVCTAISWSQKNCCSVGADYIHV